MQHTHAENRSKTFAKAIRKQKLWKMWCSDPNDGTCALNRFNKGKIHCSCWRCSAKTKNKGKRRHLWGNHAPSYNPSISDLKKIMEIEHQIIEYNRGDN